MELVRLASSVPAATLAVLPSSLAPHASFLFLGSRVADSLLLQLGSGGVARAEEGSGGRPLKRARHGDPEEEGEEDADEEERALFGAASARARLGLELGLGLGLGGQG